MAYKNPKDLFPELERRLNDARMQVTIFRSGEEMMRRNLEEKEAALASLEEIARVQTGLARKDDDPGKYGPAYSYAKDVQRDPAGLILDAKQSTTPGTTHVVDGQEYPLLIRYEQTEDGPDGDLWEKRFFVLTHRGIVSLGQTYRDGRF